MVAALAGVTAVATLVACGTLLDLGSDPPDATARNDPGVADADARDADETPRDGGTDGAADGAACAAIDDPCDADATCCGTAQCIGATCRTCSPNGGGCGAGSPSCCGTSYCNHGQGYVCRSCSGEGGPCGIVGPSGCCDGLTCGGPTDPFCR